MAETRNKKRNNAGNLCISILLISLLLLSSCSGLFKPKKDISASEIRKGTAGLDMRFLQNAPPNQIIAPQQGQKTPFQVGVILENKGAYGIRDGNLLMAVEKEYAETMGWQSEDESFAGAGASGERAVFTLEGRSELDPDGEVIVAVADVEAKPLERQSTVHTTSVMMTACYDYETIAGASVCIDTDVYNLKPVEKSCIVNDISLSGGQGGPVAVDKVEVSMMPQSAEFVRPQFTIYISNQGGGIVFRPDKVSEACSATPLGSDEVNLVSIDDVSFSGYSLRGGLIECSPNPLKLRGYDSKVVCKVKEGVVRTDTATYETLLQIRLRYGYSQTISRSIQMSLP